MYKKILIGKNNINNNVEFLVQEVNIIATKIIVINTIVETEEFIISEIENKKNIYATMVDKNISGVYIRHNNNKKTIVSKSNSKTIDNVSILPTFKI